MKTLLMFLLISSLIVSCNQKSEEPKYKVQGIADQSTLATPLKVSYRPSADGKGWDTVYLASTTVNRFGTYSYQVDSFYELVKPYKTTTTVPAPPVDTVVTTPPVVTPPTTSNPANNPDVVRYLDWSKPFVYEAVIAGVKGSGFYNTQSVNGGTANAKFPGTNIPALKISWKWPDSKSGSYRAEVQSVQNPDANNGDDYYYSFPFYAETWAPSKTWGQSFLQWHDNNGTNPPVGLQINSSNQVELTVVSPSATIREPIGAFIVGKAEKYILHIKWSSAKTGIAEVWRNGVLMKSLKNIQTLPASGGAYVKIGLNYWGATSASTPRVAYYGSFIQGKTFASVQ